jgi:hypothetical protein
MVYFCVFLDTHHPSMEHDYKFYLFTILIVELYFHGGYEKLSAGGWVRTSVTLECCDLIF